MKVLLDECIDHRLAREIKDHEVVTVPAAGYPTAPKGEVTWIR